ncbi:hypothetical protein [Serratia liquefaciens]|uniref:hypothetical protein n=1 Tax=Serratia liquefaciens TaxID=614 RepID=UPI0039AFE127
MKLDERQLSKQWLFWLSILIPLLISLILSIPLWLQTKINLSADGYDNFLRVFKLPIGVLSLSIPLVAIVAHIHRTIQTAKQIELTNQKNTTDRFFSHNKHIVDALSSIKYDDIKVNKITITPKITHPFSLYRKIFPSSSYSNGIEIDSQYLFINSIVDTIEKIESLIEDANLISADTERSNTPTIAFAMNFGELWTTMHKLCGLIEFSTSAIQSTKGYMILVKESSTNVKIVMPFYTEQEFKDMLNSSLYLATKLIEVIGSKEDFDITNYDSILDYRHSRENCIYNCIFKSLIPSNEGLIFSRGSGVFTQEEYDIYTYIPKQK